MPESSLIIDKYLDGRIYICQPQKGYRAGIDAILLAAAVSPKKSHKVLDVGTGVGTVMLAIASYFPQTQFAGLEIQQELVTLAAENIKRNHQEKNVQIFQGSILSPPDELLPNTFDHVVTNPPYFNFGATTEDLKKTISRHEQNIGIESWIQACIRMVKPRGYLTMIHRAERLDEILKNLTPKTGDIKIFPLWPQKNQAAKLVLIQARKSVNTPCQMLSGLCLHNEDKAYTQKADDIFRGRSRLENLTLES
ncbi:MAG: methyltransferase domain-containing protein [Alphaproteobacteria bacterium]|nr:methyltransferase domain-containing protein [Alphaproteobacteria bacterium]